MTGSPKGKLLLVLASNPSPAWQQRCWVSKFMPHTAGIVDELCFIKSMHTEAVNHAPACHHLLSECGAELPDDLRLALGSVIDGFGSETENLPGFVVMTSISKGTSCGQIFYHFYLGQRFLSKFQGVKFRASGEPVLYLSNPDGLSREVRRTQLDALAQLNDLRLKEFADPEIADSGSQYEMATQSSVPELTDFSDESAATLESYGPQVKEPGSFAYNCLMSPAV